MPLGSSRLGWSKLVTKKSESEHMACTLATYEGNPIWSIEDYAYSILAPDNFVILRSPTTGEPVLYDGKYWAVYSCINDGIGICSSADLYTWNDEGASPIIEIGDVDAEAWEVERIAPCDFLYMHDEAGHGEDFWMFYKGGNADKTEYSIGIVHSDDMAAWTRDLVNNPVAYWAAGWIANTKGLEDFRIQKMSNGDWCALYEADQSPTGGAAIGAAKSTETLPNTGWGDEGQVVSAVPDEADFIANPCLIRRGEKYYCYYEWDKVDTDIYGMSCEEADFFTLDGWTQCPSQPVLESPAGWENNSTIPNGLIYKDGILICYYTGGLGVDRKIGIATGTGLS